MGSGRQRSHVRLRATYGRPSLVPDPWAIHESGRARHHEARDLALKTHLKIARIATDQSRYAAAGNAFRLESN